MDHLLAPRFQASKTNPILGGLKLSGLGIEKVRGARNNWRHLKPANVTGGRPTVKPKRSPHTRSDI
jgi:hypothetical protein